MQWQQWPREANLNQRRSLSILPVCPSCSRWTGATGMRANILPVFDTHRLVIWNKVHQIVVVLYGTSVKFTKLDLVICFEYCLTTSVMYLWIYLFIYLIYLFIIYLFIYTNRVSNHVVNIHVLFVSSIGSVVVGFAKIKWIWLIDVTSLWILKCYLGRMIVCM